MTVVVEAFGASARAKRAVFSATPVHDASLTLAYNSTKPCSCIICESQVSSVGCPLVISTCCQLGAYSYRANCEQLRTCSKHDFIHHVYTQGRGERSYDIFSRLLRERVIMLYGPVSSLCLTMSRLLSWPADSGHGFCITGCPTAFLGG